METQICGMSVAHLQHIQQTITKLLKGKHHTNMGERPPTSSYEDTNSLDEEDTKHEEVNFIAMMVAIKDNVKIEWLLNFGASSHEDKE